MRALLPLTEIPLLLFSGGALYAILGLFYLHSMGGPLLNYLGFALVPALAFFLTIVLQLRKPNRDHAAYCLLFCEQLALVHTYFFFPHPELHAMHSVSSAFFLVAVLDTAPVMGVRARKLNNLGALVLTAIALAVVPSLQRSRTKVR